MKEKLIFTGKYGEYFKIWLSNQLLTLLSLGLYYPWAMVRKRKYFYKNIKLLDYQFNYTAEPRKIFKGFVIVYIFLLFLLILEYNPNTLILSTILYFVVYFLLAPYLIFKALCFRSYHTCYRNIRFFFSGNLKELYKLWFIQGFLVILTLGLSLPLFIYYLRKYFFYHLSFGTIKVKEKLKVSSFFIWYFGVSILSLVIAFFLLILVLLSYELNKAVMISYIIFIAFFYIIIIFIPSLINFGIKKHIWNNIKFKNLAKTECFYSPLKLFLFDIFWLTFSILSFGLFFPFRQIFLTQKILDSFSLTLLADINEVKEKIDAQSSAIGEVGDEAFGLGADFDFGL